MDSPLAEPLRPNAWATLRLLEACRGLSGAQLDATVPGTLGDHGTDHRSQISTILTSIGVTPPRLDGWAYGRAAGRIVSAAGPPV